MMGPALNHRLCGWCGLVMIVFAGRGSMDSQQKSMIRSALGDLGLTRRESQILEMLIAGDGTSDLARGLRIQPATVATHLRSIFSKLNVRRRSQLVTMVLQRVLNEVQHKYFSLDVACVDSSLDEIVSDIIERGLALSRQTRVPFDFQQGTDLPQQVRTDPLVLRQVLNGVLNVVMELADRGVHLGIGVLHREGESERIQFELSGDGGRVEELQEVMEQLPGEQGPSADSTRTRALASRLLICKYLIQLLGGHLTLRRFAKDMIKITVTTEVAVVPPDDPAAQSKIGGQDVSPLESRQG